MTFRHIKFALALCMGIGVDQACAQDNPPLESYYWLSPTLERPLPTDPVMAFEIDLSRSMAMMDTYSYVPELHRLMTISSNDLNRKDASFLMSLFSGHIFHKTPIKLAVFRHCIEVLLRINFQVHNSEFESYRLEILKIYEEATQYGALESIDSQDPRLQRLTEISTRFAEGYIADFYDYDLGSFSSTEAWFIKHKDTIHPMINRDFARLDIYFELQFKRLQAIHKLTPKQLEQVALDFHNRTDGFIFLRYFLNLRMGMKVLNETKMSSAAIVFKNRLQAKLTSKSRDTNRTHRARRGYEAPARPGTIETRIRAVRGR